MLMSISTFFPQTRFCWIKLSQLMLLKRKQWWKVIYGQSILCHFTYLGSSISWILWEAFHRIWINWTENLRFSWSRKIRKKIMKPRNNIESSEGLQCAIPEHARSLDHYHLDMVNLESQWYVGFFQFWAMHHQMTSSIF